MVRIWLALMALFFIVPSLLYLIDPAANFVMNGQALTVAAAHTDVRVMYGTLPIAIGLFLVPAAIGRSDARTALWLCFLLFAFIVLGRLIGLALDHGDQSFTRLCLLFEVPVMLVSGVLLFVRHRADDGASAALPAAAA